MSTLYQLTEEAEVILLTIEELEELEGQEEQLEQTKRVKALIDLEINNKSESMLYILRNIQSDIEAIDGEIKRLQALKKNKQNSMNKLKTLIKECLEKLGKKRLETSLGNLTVRNNPDSINVLDETLVPEEFVKVEVVKKVDKKKIKDWLNETDEVVPGTEILKTTSLIVPKGK